MLDVYQIIALITGANIIVLIICAILMKKYLTKKIMFPKTRLIKGAGVSNDDLDINNSIFLHMTDGIIAFDRDGKIVLINPAAQKMMNVLPEDKDFDDIFGFGRYGRVIFKAQSRPGDSELIREAVDLINGKAYAYATRSLNNIISSQRNARWYYLSSLANYGQGNELLALNQIQKAVQLEPSNMEYRTVLQEMQRSTGAYNQMGEEFQRYAEGMGRFCTSFFMMQFLCMFCRCC